MNYDETAQKLILRGIDKRLLALLVVGMDTDEYEIIYTDGAMKEFANRHRGELFFERIWTSHGMPWVYEDDRAATARAFTKERVLEALERDGAFEYECRFYVCGAPVPCTIKAKPNDLEPGTIALMFSRATLPGRKDVRIRMFGRFTVMHGRNVVPLRGKAKEILALVVSRRGKEIGNEEIYETIWEGRPYSNENMTVYYNALHRLRETLAREGLEELVISTPHGQMANTELFECDYYDWLDGETRPDEAFEGEFLTEYAWGESILADIMGRIYGR